MRFARDELEREAGAESRKAPGLYTRGPEHVPGLARRLPRPSTQQISNAFARQRFKKVNYALRRLGTRLPIFVQYVAPLGFTGNAPGGPSRWPTGRSAKWY